MIIMDGEHYQTPTAGQLQANQQETNYNVDDDDGIASPSSSIFDDLSVLSDSDGDDDKIATPSSSIFDGLLSDDDDSDENHDESREVASILMSLPTLIMERARANDCENNPCESVDNQQETSHSQCPEVQGQTKFGSTHDLRDDKSVHPRRAIKTSGKNRKSNREAKNQEEDGDVQGSIPGSSSVSTTMQQGSKKQTKIISCDICRKSFRGVSQFKSHYLIHNDIKPHKCSSCPKAFALVSNLYAHEKTHNKEFYKSFKCDYENCGRAFVQKSNLNQHISAVHKEEFTHYCYFCFTSFKSRSNWNQHTRAHMKEKQICRLCGEEFTQLSGLRKHKRKCIETKI